MPCLCRKCFYCQENHEEDINIRNLGRNKYCCLKCYKLFKTQFTVVDFSYLVIFTKKEL